MGSVLTTHTKGQEETLAGGGCVCYLMVVMVSGAFACVQSHHRMCTLNMYSSVCVDSTSMKLFQRTLREA